mmetsp:Transcript_9941/g.15118  ORF Transcript_9941/g.15118 Transcript_9941/m.15118 type:complete len:473 (+) Transcript_9941:145-1563(+)|eukprot:CAMPEP_0202710812 /NCGR_PEP_ID=MMETSP1385-20130828/22730_1 /ASSEMBLY_ACC=CAM_ASM_000861 /TAXON_ID=933848 /ORGANISM="Elphidium margaritaceum" /LENGTH=472 /DNA_ID=CAMNT_0049370419 /DNA_START=156 /DNA_END=1574 /DNA_ORIENTATION=+
MAEQEEKKAPEIKDGIDKAFDVLEKHVIAKLPSKLQSHGKKLLATAKDGVKDPKQLKKYGGALESAAKAVPKLTSSDPAIIAQGVFGLVAAACVAVPPPFGEIGAAVLGLASLVAGLFTRREPAKQKPNLSDIIKAVVQQAQYTDICATYEKQLSQYGDWGDQLDAMDDFMADGDITSKSCMAYLEVTYTMWRKLKFEASLRVYAADRLPSPDEKNQLPSTRIYSNLLYLYATLASLKVTYLQRMIYFYDRAKAAGYEFAKGEFELKTSPLRNGIDTVLEESKSMFDWVTKCDESKRTAMACLKSNRNYAGLKSYLQQCSVISNPEPPMKVLVKVADSLKNRGITKLTNKEPDSALVCLSLDFAALMYLEEDQNYPGAFTMKRVGGKGCYIDQHGQVHEGKGSDDDMSRWVALGIGDGIFVLTSVWAVNKYTGEDLWVEFGGPGMLDDKEVNSKDVLSPLVISTWSFQRVEY